MHIIGMRNGCGAIQYQLAFDGSGTGFGSINNGAMGYNSVGIPGWLPPIDAWTFLAATFDGTNFGFYTNGVLAATGTGTLGAPSSDPLEIANSGTCDQYFTGLIDEVRIYNRALSYEEVGQLYEGTTHAETLVLSSQGTQLTIGASGDPGFSYFIQSSPDLIHWTNAGIVVPAIGTFQTNLPISGTNMFFRAMLQ